MVTDLHNKQGRLAEEGDYEKSMYKLFFPVKAPVNPSEITIAPFNLNSIPLYHDQQK